MFYNKAIKTMFNLTTEQLDALIRFAEDDRQPVPEEALEIWNSINNAIQKNIIKHLTGARKRNAMLTERLEKFQTRQKDQYEQGEGFKETGLDSIDVATALLYQLQQLNTYKLNKYKLQAILYEMYASWLESKKERLFLEHPVATEFGPRFWRVFKRLETGTRVPYSAWQNFTSKNPGVAKFCENAAGKYYDYAEGTLSRIFLASKPYKNADKDHNYGKWNKEISDGEIYVWKSQQKNSKQS